MAKRYRLNGNARFMYLSVKPKLWIDGNVTWSSSPSNNRAWFTLKKEQHLQLKKEIKPAKSIYRPVRIVFKSLSFLVKVMLNILTNEIGFLDFILQENTVSNCVDK